MRAKLKGKDDTGFEPVTIEITLESQKEVDHLYNIFNYTPICNLAEEGGISLSDIRRCFETKRQVKGWGDFSKLASKYLER